MVILKINDTMKTTIKTYTVKTNFSSREIQARNKAEAIRLFKLQVGPYISKSDKIRVQ